MIIQVPNQNMKDTIKTVLKGKAYIRLKSHINEKSSLSDKVEVSSIINL